MFLTAAKQRQDPNDESKAAPRVFLITGTSTGFGAELVKVVLSNGDRVVATARNSSKLSFDGTDDSNYLAVDLDVTKKESINSAFDAALKKFGSVDVVVNNAGYGLAGEFESLSDEQIRTQMEINFFGLVDVTRRAMEVMRESGRGGVIQQITSIGGQIGEALPSFPSSPTYSPTLFLDGGTLTTPSYSRRSSFLNLLRLQMGRRRLHRSRLQRSKARMEHPLHVHRARRLPHRLGWSQHGLCCQQEPGVRPHGRQEVDG